MLTHGILSLVPAWSRPTPGRGLLLHRSTFNGPDGATISTLTPEVGSALTNVSGVNQLLIFNGRARNNEGSNYSQNRTADLGSDANYVVRGTARFMGGSSADSAFVLLGRINTGTNHYLAVLYNGGYMQIRRYEASVTTLAEISGWQPVVGRDYTIELVLNGTQISVVVNGAVLLTATDSLITGAGRAQLESAWYGATTEAANIANGWHWDSFEVETLAFSGLRARVYQGNALIAERALAVGDLTGTMATTSWTLTDRERALVVFPLDVVPLDLTLDWGSSDTLEVDRAWVEWADSAATLNVRARNASAGSGVTGASSVTLSMTGSATGTVRVAGASSATLALTGTAAGAVRVAGASSATFALTGSATGGSGTRGASVATFAITGSATGTVRAAGASAATFALTGSAAGVVRVAGASSATFGITGTATGLAPVRGASVATFALTASATGVVLVRGASTATFALTGAAAGGSGAPTGASDATFALTGSATGVAPVAGASAVTLSMTGVAAGAVLVRGASAATLTMTGAATGGSGTQGASTATFAITGSATGSSVVRGASSATLAITGSATGSASNGASSVATFAITAAATGVVRVAGGSAATLLLSPVSTGRVLVRSASTATFAITGSATAGEGDQFHYLVMGTVSIVYPSALVVTLGHNAVPVTVQSRRGV